VSIGPSNLILLYYASFIHNSLTTTDGDGRNTTVA